MLNIENAGQLLGGQVTGSQLSFRLGGEPLTLQVHKRRLG